MSKQLSTILPEAENSIEPWRAAWRELVAPQATIQQQNLLMLDLKANRTRLTQGHTTLPDETDWSRNMPVQAACPIAHLGWKGGFFETVEEVCTFFADTLQNTNVFTTDQPPFIKDFLEWWDDNPKELVCQLLADEIETNLSLPQPICLLR